MSARRTPPPRKGRAGAPEKPADRDSSQAADVERLQREIEHLREKLAKRDRQIADLERQVALRQQKEGTRRDAIVKLDLVWRTLIS